MKDSLHFQLGII